MWYSPQKRQKMTLSTTELLVILVLRQGGGELTRKKVVERVVCRKWGVDLAYIKSPPSRWGPGAIFHRVTHRSSTWSQVQGKWCSVAMQNHSHSTTCCHKHTKKEQVRKTLFQKVVELKLQQKNRGMFHSIHHFCLWMVFLETSNLRFAHLHSLHSPTVAPSSTSRSIRRRLVTGVCCEKSQVMTWMFPKK